MDLLGSKPGVKEKYGLYEERFLRDANKRILLDDGQPEVMQMMSREFIQML